MTRLAIRALSMTSEGRGYVMPEDTSLLSVSPGSKTSEAPLLLVRPLIEVLSKEVGIYNWYTGLDRTVIQRKTLIARSQIKKSIERLTEEFIVNLDKGFPATVSTVARTVSKVTTGATSDPKTWRCPICSSATQPDTADWTRRITVSRPPAAMDTASSATATDSVPPAAVPAMSAATPAETTNSDARIDLNPLICHGCRSMLSESLLAPSTARAAAKSSGFSPLLLPAYVARAAADARTIVQPETANQSDGGREKAENVESLRHKIKDFLLE